MPKYASRHRWTADEISAARRMWNEGRGINDIAWRIGVKVHQLRSMIDRERKQSPTDWPLRRQVEQGGFGHVFIYARAEELKLFKRYARARETSLSSFVRNVLLKHIKENPL